MAICITLAFLALCRAACSVSGKDISGKTVTESQRGSVTGLAGSASAIAVVSFAVLLMSGLAQSRGVIMATIALAATLWVLAALLFSRMEEKPGDETDAPGAGFDAPAVCPCIR